ncbi:hypothetical protein ART_1621 [Arthrobacter sp. PAMC 25486]|nr:hypothetical protein ART_1621 [Arthrobacter sp. PAMC 25486]
MPTSEGAATIEPNGDFSADLADTSTFLNDMWYTIRIRWQDVGAGAALADFPDWQVRVTGPGSIVDMISFGPAYGGGGGGSIPNRKVWWVGLSAPPNRSFLWLHTNPDNTDDPANTGDVREWR